MRIPALLGIALALAATAHAQELPNKPEPLQPTLPEVQPFGTVRTDLFIGKDKTPHHVRLLVPHRTADRAFWLWTGVSAIFTVADVENTEYVLRDPHVQEQNFLYGKRPSRARLWSISGPMLALTTWASWRAKRAEDAKIAYGAKPAWTPSWTHWWVAPLANAVTHAVGVGVTIANTGR